LNEGIHPPRRGVCQEERMGYPVARRRRDAPTVTGVLSSRYETVAGQDAAQDAGRDAGQAAGRGSGLAEEAAEQRRGPGHVLFHRAPGPVGIAGQDGPHDAGVLDVRVLQVAAEHGDGVEQVD